VAAAVADARAAVVRAPRSGPAWGNYGMVLAAHGFADEALACFAEAERLQPDEPRWPYYAGSVRLRSEPAAAVADLRRAVARCGEGDSAPRLRLAEALLAQGEWDDAEGLFRQVVGGDPQNVRARLGLAEIAYERSRIDECLAQLRPCVGSPLTRKAAHALLAQVYQARHDPVAAAREARAAAELPDDLPWPDPYAEEMNDLRVGLQALVDRAHRLFQQGRPDEGLALLDQAVRQYPEADLAWVSYGNALRTAGRLAAAEAAFGRAVSLSPRMAEGQFGLGAVLLARKEYAPAAEAFARAAECDPGDAQAHYNRGVCLRELGRRAEAVEAFRAAVRCKPDAARPRRALAELLAEEGHAEEAEAQLREALALDPDDAEARRLLESLRAKKPSRVP
jgi:tetratricopeptide (TPR) repeat protein